MRPDGHKEGGQQALPIAEAVLPGIGTPAAELKPDAAEQASRLAPLELWPQNVVQYARLQSRVHNTHPKYSRIKPQILNAYRA